MTNKSPFEEWDKESFIERVLERTRRAYSVEAEDLEVAVGHLQDRYPVLSSERQEGELWLRYGGEVIARSPVESHIFAESWPRREGKEELLSPIERMAYEDTYIAAMQHSRGDEIKLDFNRECLERILYNQENLMR